MNLLNRRVVIRWLFVMVAMAAMVFIPAWTLRYWQGWVFLGSFGSSILALTLFLKQKNPQLLERRLKTKPTSETRPRQKILHFIMSKALIVAIAFSVVDHRFGWSTVPPLVVAVGDLLIIAGMILVMFVFKENAFALATVEIQSEQKTITTGPYALVRHPMYCGALITFLGIPLALGSWWGLAVTVALTPVMVLRIFDEEELLTKDLLDYSAYSKRVRYRLVPLVW